MKKGVPKVAPSISPIDLSRPGSDVIESRTEGPPRLWQLAYGMTRGAVVLKKQPRSRLPQKFWGHRDRLALLVIDRKKSSHPHNHDDDGKQPL